VPVNSIAGHYTTVRLTTPLSILSPTLIYGSGTTTISIDFVSSAFFATSTSTGTMDISAAVVATGTLIPLVAVTGQAIAAGAW